MNWFLIAAVVFGLFCLKVHNDDVAYDERHDRYDACIDHAKDEAGIRACR